MPKIIAPKVSKKALETENRELRWHLAAATGKQAPWLSVPGLMVFLDTEDRDFQFRLEILNFAIKQLSRIPATPSSLPQAGAHTEPQIGASPDGAALDALGSTPSEVLP